MDYRSTVDNAHHWGSSKSARQCQSSGLFSYLNGLRGASELLLSLPTTAVDPSSVPFPTTTVDPRAVPLPTTTVDPGAVPLPAVHVNPAVISLPNIRFDH